MAQSALRTSKVPTQFKWLTTNWTNVMTKENLQLLEIQSTRLVCTNRHPRHRGTTQELQSNRLSRSQDPWMTGPSKSQPRIDQRCKSSLEGTWPRDTRASNRQTLWMTTKFLLDRTFKILSTLGNKSRAQCRMTQMRSKVVISLWILLPLCRLLSWTTIRATTPLNTTARCLAMSLNITYNSHRAR